MDASWRRLGVPAQTAHWIAHLDDHGPTAVRSPWALEAWGSAGYLGFGEIPSPTRPCTFTRDRGTPQGDVSSPHAWTAFFDIALRALAATDLATHFRMPSSVSDSALVSDLGYADDLLSLSCSLDGLQHKADLMSAFALLFDLTISAPKLRAVCLGTLPPHPTLTIHGPGWTPTVIPVRSQGSVTILGLTIDLTPAQITQPQSTRAHLVQSATILGYQRVADTTALVASVSTLAKAAYTAQFVPWSPQDLQAFDVPLNRAFRRLLQLPPSHPNALLYMSLTDGGPPTKSISGSVVDAQPTASNNGAVSQRKLSVAFSLGQRRSQGVNSLHLNTGTSSGRTPPPRFGVAASVRWARTQPFTLHPHSVPPCTLYSGHLHRVFLIWITSNSSALSASSTLAHGPTSPPAPRRVAHLVKSPLTPSGPLPPLLPTGPTPLAGRPGDVSHRTILATYQGAGGLGVGWHSPTPRS